MRDFLANSKYFNYLPFIVSENAFNRGPIERYCLIGGNSLTPKISFSLKKIYSLKLYHLALKHIVEDSLPISNRFKSLSLIV